MTIGHYGVALAAKKYAPKTPLAWLLVASQLLDLLCLVFMSLGLEHLKVVQTLQGPFPVDFLDYPLSHSLVMALVWSFLFSTLLMWALKTKPKETMVIFLVCVSHWVLDFLVHRGDLPLAPWQGSAHGGLGWWNFPVASFLLESVLFLAGLVLYERRTGIGRTASFWIFLISAFVIHGTTFFTRPQPMDGRAYFAGFVIQGYFIGLGVWMERRAFQKPSAVNF